MEDFTESYASSAFDEPLTEPILTTTHLVSQGEASTTYWDDLLDWVRSQEGLESASKASLGLFEAYHIGAHDGSKIGASSLEELFNPQDTVSIAQHQAAIQSALHTVTVGPPTPPIDTEGLKAASASTPTQQDFIFHGVDNSNDYIPPFGYGEVIYRDPPPGHHYNRALGASLTSSELENSGDYIPCITNNAQHLPPRPTAPQASGFNSTVNWDKFKEQLGHCVDIDDMKAFFRAHGIELKQAATSPLTLAQPTLPRVIKVEDHTVRRDSKKCYIKYRVLYEGHHRSSVLTPLWLPYDAPHPGFATAIRTYFQDKDRWVSDSSLRRLQKHDPNFWNTCGSLLKLMSHKGKRFELRG
ncbi:hypothetical protein CBOM_06211 [Ceraceosorus bombacis]|uniref:Uncharacterized protein n=1 Tax=Ceraceosorus bombacis TaxID=401625 RepID=A0A0P1BJ05_9BASI|nr:hypothetical protein CBOM_06211 [Ceraceosorus bombacis]